MASYNRILLIGNVGQEPKTVTFQDGSQIATFTLAVTERFNDRQGQQQERTEWFNIRVDGKSVATVMNYVHKGTQLFVEGKLQSRKYTDQQGQERATTEVRCLNFQLIGAKPAQQEQPAPVRRPAMPMPMANTQSASPESFGLVSEYQGDLPY